MADGNVKLGVGRALHNGSPEADGWGGQDSERVRELSPAFAGGQ
jgi:hypothetical protein